MRTLVALLAAGLVLASASGSALVEDAQVPPLASFLAPTDGSTVSETVSLEASASDDQGLARVDFHVDGEWIGSDTSAPYTWNWPSRTVSNGPHVLGVTAHDVAGNASSPSTVNVVVNNDLQPELVITSPASGATVSGDRVNLRVTASDDHQVAYVGFSVDHEWLGDDLTAPYSLEWNSTRVANGPHTLTSYVRDSAGQTKSVSIPFETNNPGNARYDPVLKAPRCDTVAAFCDAKTLVQGREPYWPSTLDGCTSGSPYNLSYGSIESLRVERVDGVLAAGKKVRIRVSVRAEFIAGYSLDLYAATDATQPSWTYITTVQPPSYNPPVNSAAFSVEYTLPESGLQAVRANFRRYGTVSPCSPDNSDNDQDDLVFPVAVDTAPPTVALTAPANGATLSEVLTLEASASDDLGVVAVDFLDGETLLGTVTSAPYRLTWNTRNVPNGSHTLTARARDDAGRVGTSQPVLVTVDNDSTAPVVSITSPAQGATLIGTVGISVSATDNKYVSRIELHDGTRRLLLPYSSNTYSWNTDNEATGEHVLTARAYDAAGNMGTSAQVVVTVARDTTPPAVALTSPAHGAMLTGSVTISATATDERGVTKVELLQDGNLLGTDTLAPYRFTWDTKTVANGVHTLTARATDSRGNVGTSAVSVTTDNDLTPPMVSILSPADGTTVRENLSVLAGASDDRGVFFVQLRIDGSTQGSASKEPYVISRAIRYLSNGPHTLTVEARDYAGNLSVSAPITVMVDNDVTAPTVALTSPTSAVTVPGGMLSMSADALDDRGLARVVFALDGASIGEDTTPPYSLDWYSGQRLSGDYTLTATAVDLAGNATTSPPIPVKVHHPGTAVFDPVLGAPKCDTVNNLCDTQKLVMERNSLEPHAPNTLDGCADGTSLDQAFSERIHRIIVTRVGGEFLAEKRRAKISVVVVGDVLNQNAIDLFYASDATNPSWTYITTRQPLIYGSHSLDDVEYVLPEGNLQAVRAQFRVGLNTTSESPCTRGSRDDHDDLVFAVGPPTDAFPPTVKLTSPFDNAPYTYALVAGMVPVTAEAEDDMAVERVEFYADGTLIGTDTSAPYAVSWNSAATVDGSHWLTAKAYDPAGRSTTAKAVMVNTDNTGPLVSLTSPAQGMLLRGSVVLDAIGSDAHGIQRISYYSGATALSAFPISPQTSHAATWRTWDQPDGVHRLTARAVDSLGNVGTSAEVVVTIDNTPPSAQFTAPAAYSELRGTVQVSANVTDAVGVAKVEFYAGELLLGTATTAPYTVSWDSTTGPDGSVTLTTRAYDTAGNVRESSEHPVMVDNTGPTTAITAPANGASLLLTTTIKANASDNVMVTQVVFYDGTKVIGTDTSEPYSVNWGLLGVTKGSHTLTVKAHDRAGNVTTSAPITVKVN